MKIIYTAAGLIFILTLFLNAKAQQTIFNVPSADVLDKGKVYLELDTSFKTQNQKALQRFSSFVPRVVIGAGRNIEIGLNVLGNINPGIDKTTFVPTIKYRFCQNKKKDFTLFAGNDFYLPVRNKSFNFGTYTYAAAAKIINKTRLTAGAYVFSKNVVASNAARAGGQFAFEQTINSKLALSADWLTGKHSNGYFTPGLSYKPMSKITTYFAYSIGNGEVLRGNHFFLFELGYNIN